MAADVQLNLGSGGDVVRSLDKAGVKTQVIALDLGGSGAESLLTSALPVTGTFYQATQPVSGPLTDAQLRAAAVPASLATLPALVAGSANIGDVDIVTMPAVVLAAGSAAVGSVTDGGSGKALKSASISLSATGSVVSLVSGKRIKVYAIKLVCSAALVVNWRSGASTALEGAQSIAINGGYVESVNPPSFLFGTTAGESLDLVITGVGTVAGRVSFWDEDAT